MKTHSFKRALKTSFKLTLYATAACYFVALVALVIGLIFFDLGEHSSIWSVVNGKWTNVNQPELLAHGVLTTSVAIIVTLAVLGASSLVVVISIWLSLLAVCLALALALSSVVLAAALLALPLAIIALPVYWFMRRRAPQAEQLA